MVEYSSGADTIRPINGFNLDVAAGSLVILMGPSGCGKTTLLSCLGGILRPTCGAIKFGDVDVTSLDGHEMSNYRRETVGIVFQAFNLVPSLTALENVMVPLLAAGLPRRAAHKRAGQLLSRVGLRGTGVSPAGRPERWSTAARRGRAGDRARSAADVGRRAHRAPGLHPGRGGTAAHPRTRHRRPDGGRRDPRQPDSASGRSRRRTRSRLRVNGPAPRHRSSSSPARCCSNRAQWAN